MTGVLGSPPSVVVIVVIVVGLLACCFPECVTAAGQWVGRSCCCRDGCVCCGDKGIARNALGTYTTFLFSVGQSRIEQSMLYISLSLYIYEQRTMCANDDSGTVKNCSGRLGYAVYGVPIALSSFETRSDFSHHCCDVTSAKWGNGYKIFSHL